MPTTRPTSRSARSKTGALLGATALSLTATLAAAQPAHAAPSILDFSRSITLRNMLNGPIQLNVLANTHNEGGFTRAPSASSGEIIGTTEALGVQVGVGEASFDPTDGAHPVTITERPGLGHIVPGEPVQVTVVGIIRHNGIPTDIATLTETLHCGQRDSAGTITCT